MRGEAIGLCNHKLKELWSEKPEKNSSRILVHGEGGTDDLGEGSNVHWGT